MKADTLTLAQVFNKPVSYLVPLFQRPYVWVQEKHWEPLWEDFRRVAERLIAERAEASEEELEKGVPEERTPPHFLGAIVVEQVPVGAGMVDRRRVIDGQQRLATLQLFLDAAHDVAAELTPETARLFGKLTDNDPDLVRGLSDTYKVWPTNADRMAFRLTMRKDVEALQDGSDISQTGIWKAHEFFAATIREWLTEDGGASVAERLDSLRTVLWSLVRVVVIDLDPNDNAQVIFETLNARGTPLLATDLIKNTVFQSAVDQHLDAQGLYARYWAPLDHDWWREEIRQGRLHRPRLDVFFTHWLTMRKGSEFGAHELFTEFKKFNSGSSESVEELLKDIARYARVFETFSNQPPGTPEATFFYRLDIMETTTATPLLLYVMGLDQEQLPVEQRSRLILAIESWLVRRMLSRLTTKNYNVVFQQLLTRVLKNPSTVGDVAVSFLAELEGESGVWPSDEQLESSLLTLPLYKVVGRGRLRMVLEAMEEALRAEHPGYAEAPVPTGLSIEHILPQSWNSETWPLPPSGAPAEAMQRRDTLKHTIGNLTLITGRLNSAQSNLPWREKRKQLQDFAVLYLNKHLMDEMLEWSEEAIEERTRRLASLAIRVWPGPSVLLEGGVPERPEPLIVPKRGRRPGPHRSANSISRQQLFTEFWTGFLSEFRERFPDWGRKDKPSKWSGMGFPSGRGAAWYIARFSAEGSLAVHLNVLRAGVFEYLVERRDEIEGRFGGPLVWDPREGRKSSRVSVIREGSITQRDKWHEYQTWLVETLARLREALGPELKNAVLVRKRSAG